MPLKSIAASCKEHGLVGGRRRRLGGRRSSASRQSGPIQSSHHRRFEARSSGGPLHNHSSHHRRYNESSHATATSTPDAAHPHLPHAKSSSSMRGSVRSLLRSARKSVGAGGGGGSASTLGSSASSFGHLLGTRHNALAERISAEDWDAVRSALRGGGDPAEGEGGDGEADDLAAKSAVAAVAELGRCRDLPSGSNALHFACRFCPPPDVVRMLEVALVSGERGEGQGEGDRQESSNNPFAAEDCASRVPLHYAVKYGCSPEVAALLLRRYPSAASRTDVVGKTPLHHFAESYASHRGGDGNGNFRQTALKDDMKLVAKLLLRADLSAVNVEDDEGMTPIEYAIFSPDDVSIDISVVRMMQKGSEKDWKNKASAAAASPSSASARETRNAADSSPASAAADAGPASADEPRSIGRESPPSSPDDKEDDDDDEVRRTMAVADLLGSVDLAAVSSALDKSNAGTTTAGKTDPALADRPALRIPPFEPKRRTSPRALCA
uniref:Uncharacterized protein n=1 Tax=Pseudictyota dubia TaxID=2749911 RepID=A0A7R9WKD6_9STRA|mmetsp:Transcript_7129/g.12921  ORF Transcript_7129/g.12921 Transcript_7129/m.12921 type:complete len:496 (+) Transcript_7129:87-1574(+)